MLSCRQDGRQEVHAYARLVYAYACARLSSARGWGGGVQVASRPLERLSQGDGIRAPRRWLRQMSQRRSVSRW